MIPGVNIPRAGSVFCYSTLFEFFIFDFRIPIFR